LFVIAKYHDVLRRLGLDSIEGVKRFSGSLVKNHQGRRDIQRIETTAGTQRLVFFLKRNWRPYRKDGLRCLFTRGTVWSQSRVEWENCLALQRAGIGIAEPIAFGEECALAWEKSSFLLTAAVPGEQTVEEFLSSCDDAVERRKVFDALADDIRKMHDAGLASPDLFTRHIFIERGTPPKFWLIDMARLDRRRRLSLKLRARDLAALHVTAPLRHASTRERLRFLRRYGGDRLLREAVRRRAAHLLKRTKFADFSSEKA